MFLWQIYIAGNNEMYVGFSRKLPDAALKQKNFRLSHGFL
jgi:hypothetical protein